MAYTNIEDLRSTLDDEEFMKLINKVYSEHSVRLLAMSDQNFRVMTTNKKIESIEDFKGQKIRTMENKYHLAFWQEIERILRQWPLVKCTLVCSKERLMRKKIHMKSLYLENL